MRFQSALSLFLLCLAGHEATALAQSPGAFTSTGNMITARFGHTATLLSNGKVLIAGGNIVCYFTAVPCSFPTNAELYDPATGTFTATGGMSTVHPLGGILLPDDRVLFAGIDVTRDPAVVEIYDPSTGNFTLAGNPKTIIGVSSATLLHDGRVLLTGTSGSFVAGAELYDPATGTFTPVPNWFAEDPMSATLLVDGRVFLQYYEDYAQIYDPVAGTFSQTEVLFWFDNPPAATLLLSGSVLFTGGNGDLGGSEKGAELYDFSANTFAIATMPVARDGHTATLLPDGTVLLAGGLTVAANKYPATNTADIYTPATGSFTATANMIAGRAGHTATLLKNGQVLIAGGSGFGSLNSINGISSAELYTPNVLVPAPVLFSLSGDGQGQGAIWDATTGTIASPSSPAAAGEILSMYTTSLADGGVISPQVAVGGRLAEVLYFGPAPGYPSYYQVNFRVPNGITSGPNVLVRLSYLNRPSNEVSIAVQ